MAYRYRGLVIYLLLVTAACAEHLPNCIEYSSAHPDECVKCQERFYLKRPDPTHILEKPSCEACSPGCLKCNDPIGCQQCDSMYTQRPPSENARCIRCDKDCRTCGREPDFCTSCPILASLDKTEGRCLWTFRIIIITLAAIALLLLVIACFTCRKNSQRKRKNRHLEDNILDPEFRADGKDPLISSVNMIGMGNDTNLSEVERRTEEPYSKTEDYNVIKTHLIDKRVKLV